MPVINQIIHQIQVSGIRRFDEAVSPIPDIIKLTLGEPDLPTPAHIKKAAIQAIRDDCSHYSPLMGFQRLQVAASQYFNQKYGLTYAPSEIIATVGATEAVATALLTCLNPGDGVLLPTPNYASYQPVVAMAQAHLITVDTTSAGYKLTPAQLVATIAAHKNDHLKAIILNYPTNPTGITYTKAELAALVTVIRSANLLVISDEIYSELTYEQPHTALATLYPEKTITINGLSKSHAMTGWRLGFIMAPLALINEMKKTHQYLVTSTSSISQMAGIEALTNGLDDGAKMRDIYQARRDYLISRLSEIGLNYCYPTGAFYVFAQVPADFTGNSWAFATQLAQQAHVAVIPGSAFGPAGEGWFRISYAASMTALRTSMNRLAIWRSQVPIKTED
ncbi:aromatic amino acid specific aminotransferase [Lactobacillus plantarum JDM1] [Lactiplantibacillus mudanjiangensis]|uniref:aminotransferase class I/II-fold pyridoxal phosphate-dependent enzyme n=1 Tax=Lactiplantibacillus mudanjiangensis TaxID=1296538 RepID=UPI0010141901|nr:aminotransferase class I/II-fold pyridoxal phosphate-dependent enzyme [Lactiplantibacillus mudanjiangensis]VDG18893.1 aromatic amino acid specific aminotransferase [Lactobacillus plantarum JDM1] [Lactiplantibacillus mudanjiangensis]VDG32991.1 aromatic amino acid specific aminotransferase [Lactobacillus plantarum JDM1] [Lactiplantibacillus mudanjiangensis]